MKKNRVAQYELVKKDKNKAINIINECNNFCKEKIENMEHQNHIKALMNELGLQECFSSISKLKDYEKEIIKDIYQNNKN